MSSLNELVLREGAFYRRRDGRVIGPARLLVPEAMFPWQVGDEWYTPHGAWDLAGASSLEDLIEEVSDPVAIRETNCVSQAALLTTDSQERKDTPIYSGVLKYFPLALAEVAKVSKTGNDKHNPGQPLHWSKGKSNDHADCVARHLLEAGTIDVDDGHRHSAKLAWRALALLQTELEEAAKNKAA